MLGEATGSQGTRCDLFMGVLGARHARLSYGPNREQPLKAALVPWNHGISTHGSFGIQCSPSTTGHQAYDNGQS